MDKQKISRNEFLRLAGLTAGAIAMQACAAQTSPPPAKSATQSAEQVKVEAPIITTKTQPPPEPTQTQTIEPTQTNEPSAEGYPRFGLFQTEARSFTSNLLGREYQLAVYVPESYPVATKPYPILYLLDGDVLFGMAAGLMPFLNRLDGIPEMIIVGICYNIKSFSEWDRLRILDFHIPGFEGAPENSHADLFLAALKQEIIPYIETNYRADPNKRILYGYSSSGFFALYSLLNEPDLFQLYLSGSPGRISWIHIYRRMTRNLFPGKRKIQLNFIFL